MKKAILHGNKQPQGAASKILPGYQGVYKTCLKPPEADMMNNSHTTTATWCPNCKELLPQLARLRSQFTEDELTMYGVPIDLNDDVEELTEYCSTYRPAYELLLELTSDQVGAVERILKDSDHGSGLPSTIVTDSAGAVLLTTWGAPSVSELRRLRFNTRVTDQVR